VYPAGFVYVYAALRHVTGGAVAAAQPLFAVLYVATLAVVLCIYIAAAVVPPWALPLLCLSKRVHSLYLLRLFNDPVAMLPAFLAVLLAQRRHWRVSRVLRCRVASLALTRLSRAQAGGGGGVERGGEREDERAAGGARSCTAHAARRKHGHHRRRCCPCTRPAGTQTQSKPSCAASTAMLTHTLRCRWRWVRRFWLRIRGSISRAHSTLGAASNSAGASTSSS
jgi:hypothetical protein